MANTGQYDSQTNIELEDYEREIFVRPEAAVIYGGSTVNSVNGQVGDVVLTTSDLENTSDYQTGAQVQNAIAGKQDKLTAGTNIQINNDVISATDTTYSAGSGLNLDGTTFSVDTNIIATVQDVTDEATIRENSDIGLQGQIDAITSSSDVKDIVGTYTELQNYDTSTLGNDDIIKVLQDSTHNNAMTYYRWIISGGAGSWQYIGEEGPYYTKSETETLLNNKQDEITSSNKLLSDLVDDTNQTNKFVTENEKTTWNTEIENLQEEDELLKRNLLTTTGSGEEVTLEKTTELDFVKPPLPRGNTKQDTTTGKNLLQNTATSQTISGVTFTVNDDQSVTCNGVSSSTVFFRLARFSNDGTTKKLSGCPSGGSFNTFLMRFSESYNDFGDGVEFSGTETAQVIIRIAANYTCNNLTFYPMIRLATIEDDTYEPYTGGIPSPNPSYPQEVEVVTGNVEVTISNENNTESKTLPVSLGNIELCKIGNYQDVFIKENNDWKIPNKTIKIDNYNGETITTPYISTTGGLDIGATVYYVGTNDLLITDATLISQLEEISKTLSYQGQTNITSNTIALFNVEAYQDTKLILAGKANKISVVQTSASTIEINSNTFYKFGEVTSLNITLASITDNTIYNEYMFEFVSGTTATTLTLPSSIKWLETPTIDANKIYQCSIVDNIGILVGVANV